MWTLPNLEKYGRAADWQEGLDSLEENILPGMLSQSMQYGAVVCGAGRIPGDISHCVGTVGERL